MMRVAFSLFYVYASSRWDVLQRKMSLRELLRVEFFIVGCHINGKLITAESRLSDNDEKNYKVFESFSRERSNVTVHYAQPVVIVTLWW